jgi:hypothetical protein
VANITYLWLLRKFSGSSQYRRQLFIIFLKHTEDQRTPRPIWKTWGLDLEAHIFPEGLSGPHITYTTFIQSFKRNNEHKKKKKKKKERKRA